MIDEQIGLWTVVTMRDAADALKIRPDQLDRATQMRIAVALKELGFVRTRSMENGIRVYAWRKQVTYLPYLLPHYCPTSKVSCDACFIVSCPTYPTFY